MRIARPAAAAAAAPEDRVADEGEGARVGAWEKAESWKYTSKDSKRPFKPPARTSASRDDKRPSTSLRVTVKNRADAGGRSASATGSPGRVNGNDSAPPGRGVGPRRSVGPQCSLAESRRQALSPGEVQSAPGMKSRPVPARTQGVDRSRASLREERRA